MKKTLLIIFPVLLLLGSCSSKKVVEYKMQGQTMGTTWSAVVQYHKSNKDFFPLSQPETQADIERELKRINDIMSTYQKDSELSRFNQFKKTKDYQVSFELYHLIQRAINISQKTQGKYDVTVGPLVNLWGFGPQNKNNKPPTKKEIQKALNITGFQKLELKKVAQNYYLRKQQREMYIDLNSIAKGYAVDKVFEMLQLAGFSAIMVEIGGEVRSSETNLLKKKTWRIAIEKPLLNKKEVFKVINLKNKALASSGNYRNYFQDIEDEKVFWGHTIDPVSGQAQPVEQEDFLSAVSVIDENCASADAWATAFMVLGKDKAIEVATQEGVIAFFMWANDNQKEFSWVGTNGFEEYIYRGE